MVMSPADRERNWKARENALLGQIDQLDERPEGEGVRS
jgi:hypothetical protein